MDIDKRPLYVLAIGMLAVVWISQKGSPRLKDGPKEPYIFSCFDMYGKKISHEGVVLQTLSHGGTWILTLEDSTEIYYTAQHGETCLREISTGVVP